jgi:predicted GTPase
MRTVILGAAGRDFHDFLVLYRDDPNTTIVAFTATQIPYIDDRRFPAALAGSRYPEGIPIVPEDDLEALIERENVEQCVFAYSDVTNDYVARMAARCNAAGCDFVLPGTRAMIPGKKPILSICAVRTGCGKSQATRYVLEKLRERGLKAVGIRHPMPYGDLARQAVQRFATRDDLVTHECTVEEREEYEPYVENGHVVYAGVDYTAILRQAEAEADVVLWDGGNNDLPFLKPDLHIVLDDPHRPGDGLRYYPSEAQLRLADVIFIAKSQTAPPAAVAAERELMKSVNPTAKVLAVASTLTLDPASGVTEADLAGKRVVVVEDGPTTTHGGMLYGAGTLLAQRAGAQIVDPRGAFVGELAATYEKYPKLGELIPAMGYSPGQLSDLEASINNLDVDYVISGTPIALEKLVTAKAPILRVRYDLDELEGEESIDAILDSFLADVHVGV